MNITTRLRVVLFWGVMLVAGTVGLVIAADTTVRVPHYGAGLAPEQPAAAAPPGEVQPEWAKRLETKIDRMLKLLDELDATPDEKTGAKPPTAAALQSGAEVCARCHSATTYASDGNSFQLFDEAGAFRKFNERDIDKIVGELVKERMPPPKKAKLTKEERVALIEAFSPKK